MKTRFLILVFFYLFPIGIGNIYSQVTFEATVENQNVSGTDFYFDIFLKRTGTNDLYLGNAQFILTFNIAAFTSPTIIKEAASNWNLVSTDLSSVGSTYRTNTAVTISGNQLQISVNGPTPSDQEGFDAAVAKIDNQASTHRIGRYKISGISISSQDMELQWVSSGDPRSKVFTIANSDPWNSTEASGTWTPPTNQPLPIELTSFNAKAKGVNVELAWETKTEVNNYGFEVERSQESEVSSQNNLKWEKIGFIKGNGNTNSPKEYSYTDKSLTGGSKFIYRLKQIDNDGKFTYSQEIEIKVVPNKYELSQNYPNPFNPETNIKFSLTQTDRVRLDIFNIIGEHVITLIDKDMEAGFHSIPFNAMNLPSGTYIYRIHTNDFSQTKKMLLIK